MKNRDKKKGLERQENRKPKRNRKNLMKRSLSHLIF